MLNTLGQFSILFALGLAATGAISSLVGIGTRQPAWIRTARNAVFLTFAMLTLGMAVLEYGFLTHDYSLKYVAANANNAMPAFYVATALWGGHEGSMLLWTWLLSMYAGIAAWLHWRTHPQAMPYLLMITSAITFGFLCLIAFLSNPFELLPFVPQDGRGLNPLLQDPGMVFHPPFLYLGYVGFAIPFAFAMAALLRGRINEEWIRATRRWTLFAWLMLTFGIVLGGYWAYYELGWGGYWAWDPVENASFMPWLVATALIHSLAVTEKRGAFKAWTVLLAIFAFSLSLLGTFLVRSGVLTSVHAFASDPARGLFILIFLAIVIGGSLLLYSLRAPGVRDVASYGFFSRENLLLLNNILLVTAAGSILLGTLYPLVLDALGLGKISVGPPYFSTIFVPLMTPVFLLAGIGPMFGWRQAALDRIWGRVHYLCPLSYLFGIGLAAAAFEGSDLKTMAGLGTAVWLAASSLATLWNRVRLRGDWAAGLRAQSLSTYGMTAAHLGLAVFLTGVVISGRFSEEKLVRMAPGDSVTLSGYTFRFFGTEKVTGPNFVAQEGKFRVEGNGDSRELKPQKRSYRVQRNPMTEAAIDPGLWRDLYVALGEPMDHGAWSVRLYVKPFMRWVWCGALLMIAGGLVAANDRRYRLSIRNMVITPEHSPATKPA